MDEPRIAFAASPREWAQALHRHVVDHGGALVRATVLHPHDALAEDFDVFIADDSTSFLTRRLVEDLHRLGRTVLGVFDPDDPRGKGDLIDCGVDDVIARNASAQEFLAAITALHARSTGSLDAALDDLVGGGRAHADAGPGGADEGPRRALLTVVGGAGGGVGATEVAIGLAAACGARREATVLVDVDEVAPAVAQRLSLPCYPNVRAAVDAVEHGSDTIAALPLPAGGGRFAAVPGLSNPRSWSELHPASTVDVLRCLASSHQQVIANVAPRLEDLGAAGGPSRYAVSRAVVGAADVVVGVAAPSPVGMARLLEWYADVRSLTTAPVHVLFNRAPTSPFKRGELADELGRTVAPAGVSFAPFDPRVEAAAWAGELVQASPFAKALSTVAHEILPPAAVPGRGRGRRRGRTWA